MKKTEKIYSKMRMSDILEMSITNLWRRKTRTFLTVLGVVIGTASIVVMLSLGLGLKEAMMAEVSTAGGLTEIMVYSDEDYGVDEKLLSDDTLQTFRELEYVENVEPQLAYMMPIQVGKYETETVLMGVSKEFLSKIELGEGKMPSPGKNLEMIVGNQVIQSFMVSATGEYPYWDNDELPDVDLLRTPIVGGIEHEEEEYEDVKSTPDSSVVDSSFSDDSSDDDDDDEDNDSNDFSSVDDFSTDSDYDYEDDSSFSYSVFSSSTKRVPLKVTGISAGDEDTYTEYSDYCYVELDSLKDFLRQNYPINTLIPGQPTDREGKPYRDLKYTQFTVKVDKSDNVEEVLETIQEMGYSAEANKEWLEEVEKEFMIIEAVLGAIGGVAMLVAAISIANTMTMSTYERTKEIGVMKVLGCSLSNIRSMFLAEAAFIGMLGGVAGVGLSYLLSIVVNKVAPNVMEMDVPSGMNISQIPLWLVAVAIIFSTIIGMLAGFFPAQRATRLSPLAAIRNE